MFGFIQNFLCQFLTDRLDVYKRQERRFGPIHGRYILYRGEDAQMENGVQYWNVENYLKALPTLDIVQVQEIGMQSIEPTL